MILVALHSFYRYQRWEHYNQFHVVRYAFNKTPKTGDALFYVRFKEEKTAATVRYKIFGMQKDRSVTNVTKDQKGKTLLWGRLEPAEVGTTGTGTGATEEFVGIDDESYYLMKSRQGERELWHPNLDGIPKLSDETDDIPTILREFEGYIQAENILPTKKRKIDGSSSRAGPSIGLSFPAPAPRTPEIHDALATRSPRSRDAAAALLQIQQLRAGAREDE
jgi:hypothetical protein